MSSLSSLPGKVSHAQTQFMHCTIQVDPQSPHLEMLGLRKYPKMVLSEGEDF